MTRARKGGHRHVNMEETVQSGEAQNENRRKTRPESRRISVFGCQGWNDVKKGEAAA